MRFFASSTALGFALVAGASAAQAQQVGAVIVPPPGVVSEQPLLTVPAVQTAETVTTQTERTVRPVRPAPVHTAHTAPPRQVVTTRTVTRRVMPTSVVARTVPVAPQPLYDAAVPPPLYDAVAPGPITASDDDYGPPLYDEAVPVGAAPVPVVGPAPLVPDGAVVATQPFVYRYVYEPDRILVIDPTTGIAIQSIPR